MSEEFVSLDDVREKAFEYEQQKALQVARFFTGIAGTQRTDWGMSVGRAFQGLIEGKFIQTLSNEVKYFEEQGRIKKDFRSSDTSQMCFAELLKFLEQDIPDPQRLDLLKKIYIVAATEEKSERNSPLPLQFMQLARMLNAGELLVLFSAYQIRNVAIDSQHEFVKLLIDKTGLMFEDLVSRHFDELFKKRLMREKMPGTGGATSIKSLMEPFGLAFCEYVEYYDSNINVEDV